MSTSRLSVRPSLIDAGPAPRFASALALKSDESAPAAGRRSAIPWGVAGMIGLIVAIECFVSRNWLDFTDPVSLSWRYSAEAVRTDSSGRELLCLGDSLVKHGLIPRVIEEG